MSKVLADKEIAKEAAAEFVAKQQEFIKGNIILLDGDAVHAYLTIAFSNKPDGSIRTSMVGMNVSDEDVLCALKTLAEKLHIPVVELGATPTNKRELN